MGAILNTVNMVTAFCPIMISVTSAMKTASTPTTGPKNAPAIGPTNWNRVKNWFSVPINAEKLIRCVTNANAANIAMKNSLFGVKNSSIFFIMTNAITPYGKPYWYENGVFNCCVKRK